MQTAFIYGSVLVKDVCTEFWDLSSEKESTGVDQIGIRGQLVLTGIVHAKEKASGDEADDHTGVRLDNFRADLMTLLKSLSKDRRRFTLTMGGRTIFTVGPGAVDVAGAAASSNRETILDKMDIDNGPKVSVQVVKITGGVAAHIRFTISFLLPNCGSGANKSDPSGLVNFRFWIHEDINCRTWLTTRTYMGRIRVAHKNVNPKRVARLVTVPPLEDGFQRQVVRWDESSDGLTLDFTFQDEEKIASAPWNRLANLGAIDWDGSLTASTGNTFGFTGNIDFRLRLVGPKTTSKADLIGIGMRVAESKARFFEAASALQQQNGALVLLDSLAVTEQLHENSIEIAATIRHTGGNIINGILSVGAEQLLGKPMGDLGINYDPEKHFSPGQTAGTGGLFVSILQTPCEPTRMPRTIASPPPKPSTPSVPSQNGGTPSYSNGGLQPSTSAMSPSQLTSMYLEYLLSSRIEINTGKIALSTGAAKDSNADTLAVVNLHRQTALRFIHIDATRVNEAPQLPDPSKTFKDANGITHTLVGMADFEGQAPQISADNRKLVFRAQAHLTYAMSRAPKAGESLPIGCVPYRTASQSDPSRVLPSNSFIDPKLLLS